MFATTRFIPSSLYIPISTAPWPPLTLRYPMVVHIAMKMTVTPCFGSSPREESWSKVWATAVWEMAWQATSASTSNTVDIKNSGVPETKYARYRLANYTGSGFSLDMIRPWLRECIDSHTTCNSGKTLSRPTRLLDLTTFGDGHIRLARGTEMGYCRYATLSYSWGGWEDFVPCEDNFEKFKKCIELQALYLFIYKV